MSKWIIINKIMRFCYNNNFILCGNGYSKMQSNEEIDRLDFIKVVKEIIPIEMSSNMLRTLELIRTLGVNYMCTYQGTSFTFTINYENLEINIHMRGGSGHELWNHVKFESLKRKILAILSSRLASSIDE